MVEDSQPINSKRINYVSFSVYGIDPKYLVGALENLKLVKSLMPGWVPILYISRQSHEIIGHKIPSQNVMIVVKDEDSNHSSMTWRFEAIGLPKAGYVAFRDTDSRITRREAIAVQEWVDSARILHIMRDHPMHGSKILGGMWGIFAPQAKHLVERLSHTEKVDSYGMDQLFLAENVYKQFKHSRFVHDSYFFREFGAKKFPLPRASGEYIGEVIDQHGQFDAKLRGMTLKADRSRLARLQIAIFDMRVRFTQELRIRWHKLERRYTN